MNSKEYRISVIMGIHNCAFTLPEALDSLLAQTYQEFKVILCDDGSTDNTYEVALKYAGQYENFILLRNEENKGLNFTLNKCLQYADTAFVARMDGDDISLPTRFEEEIAVLDEHPEISIVSTAMIHFDEQGEFRTSKLTEYPQTKDFVKGTPFCHATCLVRKESYDAVNGYTVEDSLLRVEDYHLWYKMYRKGYRGYNITKPLYRMRDDRAAISRRKFRYRINEARVMYNAVVGFQLPLLYRIYAIRPILIGLLPICLYRFLRSFKK
jgi:glycosyltransferase EpsE